MKTYPIHLNTRNRFKIDTALYDAVRRRIDVETTSYDYRDGTFEIVALRLLSDMKSRRKSES